MFKKILEMIATIKCKCCCQSKCSVNDENNPPEYEKQIMGQVVQSSI